MDARWSNERIVARWHELSNAQPIKTPGDVLMRDVRLATRVSQEMRDDYEAELSRLQQENAVARSMCWDYAHRVDKLLKYADRLRALLESLTPGGSEFSGDPDRCAEWIRARLAASGKLALERNRLRAMQPSAEVRQAIREMGNESLAIAESCDPEWGDKLKRWARRSIHWLESLEGGDAHA